ncbi:hypothetical protein TNCV_2943461 [Trichonephila clavipes]|nr:hypothetical protein TNCV_2943461 [Trichonephila clavipes]
MDKKGENGASLTKNLQTNPARLCSGRTRALCHLAGLEVYLPCPISKVTQAAPAHILAGIGCRKSQLLSSSTTVLHCLETHGFMDLI